MSEALKPYQLLDSGEGRKLELLGDILIDRQSNVALWKRNLADSEWKQAHAIHHRSETGAGKWEIKRKIPESWMIEHGILKLKVKLTGFGHLGFFPEVVEHWNWFKSASEKIKSKLNRAPKFINLFGYTGGSTLALSLGGAEVTHVDAAKGIVDWGKELATVNECPVDSIRWIVDDCLAFMKREQRRGKFYDGVVMDPPSFGRGPNKEVWKIEEHIGELLDCAAKIMNPEIQLVHFSSHSDGFTPEVLKNLLCGAYDLSSMQFDQGEMLTPERRGKQRRVPSGVYCRGIRT